MQKIVTYLALLLLGASFVSAEVNIKALIVDGQNNHGVWAKSTQVMKQYLEGTGLFEVDIERTVYTWRGGTNVERYALNDGKAYQELEQSKQDPDFRPDFSKYDVVISNFGWKAADWPEQTRKDFEAYIAQGGGFVVVHAANNAWGNWAPFNEMIGLGGWGGRSEKDGPYVYFNDEGKEIRDNRPGGAGGHGPKHSFMLTVRDTEHPITKGLPAKWLHTEDECYHHLRGPAVNMNVLATAYSSKDNKGTGNHEPALMSLSYDKGRIFHTILGHDMPAFTGVGFITTFCRGVEWAATGEVTQEVPADFPTEQDATRRPFVEAK